MAKRTKTQSAWSRAKQRCYDKNHHKYHLYGARGIVMCQRWLVSFQSFLADMGEAPSGYSLDRIDVNGNYEPGNCRWIPMAQQAQNKRTTLLVTAFGETKCAAEWGRDRRSKADGHSVAKRINRLGWEPEKAITTPVRSKDRRKQEPVKQAG
jgi:hypothetical protein